MSELTRRAHPATRKENPVMTDVILSPDLALSERREHERQRRLLAAANFKIGQRVKAGVSGLPGILEGLSENGFAAIRWDDGSLLCGASANELLSAHAGAEHETDEELQRESQP